jgi:hypothetical protein
LLLDPLIYYYYRLHYRSFSSHFNFGQHNKKQFVEGIHW